jgi:hypothetical protein
MAYVQRDGSSNIIGVFANPQPGYATEFVADNDASLTAFIAKTAIPQLVSAMQAKVALSNAGCSAPSRPGSIRRARPRS